jgi:hypothetical protein
MVSLCFLIVFSSSLFPPSALASATADSPCLSPKLTTHPPLPYSLPGALRQQYLEAARREEPRGRAGEGAKRLKPETWILKPEARQH